MAVIKKITAVLYFLTLALILHAGPEMDIFESLLHQDSHELEMILRNNPALIDAVSSQTFRESRGDLLFSSQGLTPLMFCIKYDLDGMIPSLFELGALPDAPGSQGWTPLLLAAEKGHTWAVKMLLDHGAQREQSLDDGHSALSLALEGAHYDTADLLIQRGSRLYSEVLLQDSLGEQIYHRKITLRESLVLLDRGLDSHILLEGAANGDTALIQLLILQGMEPDARDSHGISPLMTAVNAGEIHSVRTLLELGADPNGADIHEIRPMVLAAARGDTHIMEMLYQCGADLNRGNSLEYTALYHAIIYQQPRALNWLLERDIELNRRDSQGRTALMIAAYLGNLGMVNALLSHDAVAELSDFQGYSAIYYGLNAYQRNGGVDYYTILDRLIEVGLDPRNYASMARDPRFIELLEARWR